MASCLYRDLLCSVGYSDSKKFGDFEQDILAPSNADPLDAPISTPAPVKYTKKALQTMTIFCMDLFLQAQANYPKPAGHQKVEKPFRYCRCHWYQQHLFLQLYLFVVGSVFVGTNISVGKTRQ